jgi:hypothetical protein
MHNLSDEVLCARWVENPLYQDMAVNDFHACTCLRDWQCFGQDWNSDDGEELAEPYIRSAVTAGAKIPHSGEEFPGRQDQSITAAGRRHATGSRGL